jgi:long-chain acyl-CoA synthetase
VNVVEEIFGRRGATGEPALITPEGEVVGVAQLAASVERTARALVDAGVAGVRGGRPRVGLLCPDGREYVVLALALLKIEACLVPIPSELAPPERTELARRVALDRLVVAEPFRAQAGPLRGPIELNGVRACIADACATPAGSSEGSAAALEPGFIRFSSGTTGAAKGILLSHPTLLERLAAVERALGIDGGDRVVWMLPMAHHFVASILLYLWTGATILLVRSGLAADVLEVGRRLGGTVLYAAPFHHALLAAEPSQRPWPGLRLAYSTATSLPAATAERFDARFGVPLSQVLGIMEVGLPAVNRLRPREKPESVGRPAPGFAIELRDEQGRPVPTGGVGALHVRGPGMLDAYVSPWRRREDLLRDGWLATGDLATADAEGDLRLVGRIHTVIDVGGLKCFPEEIEAVLAEHPAVRAARVTARDHARVGSVPVAEIVPADPRRPPDVTALARHCRDRLASFKVPVDFRLVAELASTASGKVKR